MAMMNNQNNYSSKNKRIAKNTVLLYIRSFIVMIVALYTSRVILKALGVEDYGLFNAVGGVVGLFAFLRSSMTKSTQRFLNFEMAKPNGRLKETFSVSLTIHVFLALIALILAETIGLWFLNTYIQIPDGRNVAANMVYQGTVISLVFTIISVPYSASIIAHEKMGFFALVSVIDAFLKLAICYLILIGDRDRLIVYGWLMMGVNVLNFVLYAFYCKKRCPETSFRLLFNKELMKEMLGYTTWTVVGQVAIVGTNQGTGILMNMFHSVTANAALGVASQVNNAVLSLTSNFQTAFNPQITKSYAAKDYDYLKFLVFSTSKISYMLLIFVMVPIAFNIDTILDLWLEVVPQHSASFVLLIFGNTLLNAMSAPFNYTVLSSGKIKRFQIVTSIVFLSDLLFVYLLFSIGFPPETALVVKVLIMVVILFVRVYFANKEVPCIDGFSYFKEVALPLILSSIITVSLGLLIFSHVDNIIKRIVFTLLLTIISFLVMYYIGLNKRERSMVNNLVSKRKK